MKKFIVFSFIVLTFWFSYAFANNFTDLDSSHWAYEPINDMMARGVLLGYPDGTFRPDASITRAEFAKILVSALNLKEDSNTKNIVFEDVPDSYWAKDYIRIASNYLSAYNTGDGRLFFKPNDKAAREDVTVAMVISLGLHNEGYSFANLNKFTDKDEISSSLKKYVAIAVEHKLINGFDDGTFRPKDTLTRAQVSQLIKNASDNFNIDSTPANVDILKFNKDDLTIDLGDDFEKYTFTAYGGNPYQPSQRVLVYNGCYENGKKITSQKSSVPDVDLYGSREFYSFIGNESSTANKKVTVLNTTTKEIVSIDIPNPFLVTVKVNEKEMYSSYANMYGDTEAKRNQGYYMPVLAGQKVSIDFDLLNGLKYAQITVNPFQEDEKVFTTYDSHYEFNIPNFDIKDTGEIRIKVVDKKDNYDVISYNYVDKRIYDLNGDFYFLTWCRIMSAKTIEVTKDSSENMKYEIADYCRVPMELYDKKFDFSNPKETNKLVWIGLDSDNKVGAIIPINDSMNANHVYNGTYYSGPSISELMSDFEFKDFNGRYVYNIYDEEKEYPIDISGAKIYSAIEGKNWGKTIYPGERWGFIYDIKAKLAYAIHSDDYSKIDKVYLIALADEGVTVDNGKVIATVDDSEKTPIIDIEQSNDYTGELFSDIKYDYKTGTLDMGSNYSQYLYTWSYNSTGDRKELFNNIQNHYNPCYTPAQRTLNYYHGQNDEGEMIGGAGNTRYGGYYLMVANKNNISQNKVIDLSRYSIGGDISFDPNKDIFSINSLNKYLIAPGKIEGDSYIAIGEFIEPTTMKLSRGSEVTSTTFAGDYLVVALKSNPKATKLFHTKKMNTMEVTNIKVKDVVTKDDNIIIEFSRNIDALEDVDIGITYNGQGYPIDDIVTIKNKKITIKGKDLFKQLEKRPLGSFDSTGKLKDVNLSLYFMYDKSGLGYYGTEKAITLSNK